MSNHINTINAEAYQVQKSEENRILSNKVLPQNKQKEWNKLHNLDWVPDDSYIFNNPANIF